jgi:hypothetical protein
LADFLELRADPRQAIYLSICLISLSLLPARAMNVSARTRHMITTPQPLIEQQLARLERLRNSTTRQELAAINGDRKILVCHASRTSRCGIRAALEGRVDALANLTGDNGVTWAPRAADGCRMGDWTIRFTGRTQPLVAK